MVVLLQPGKEFIHCTNTAFIGDLFDQVADPRLRDPLRRVLIRELHVLQIGDPDLAADDGHRLVEREVALSQQVRIATQSAREGDSACIRL